MFGTVLVANRGEIAVRVIRALRDMKIRSVAVFSDADRGALHVRLADQAEHIGPAPSAESYLRVDRILEAAKKHGAEAIHPGYGFLSENAGFAEACATARIVFIGPSAEAIRLLGSKTAARILAKQAGAPVVPAIEAAGKAGVPVILTDIPLPQAKYGVVVWSQNQIEADAGALGLIQKGNVLIVRGLAGNPNDVVLYNQKIDDLKYCPNIKLAASIYGDWDNASAKTAVAQYIAAHPGQINGVLQDGGMAAGVIDAFQSAGQKVPVVSDGECYAGDLSWWLAHKSTYKTVAGCFNGYQGAYVFFNTALRILAGDGPKYQTLEIPAPQVTNANLAKFAVPGLPITSPDEVGGPVTAWCSDTCLNAYFNKAGTPGGL